MRQPVTPEQRAITAVERVAHSVVERGRRCPAIEGSQPFVRGRWWGWERGAQVQASGRKVRGPSRHVNVECILGTVVIGEPKGLNQARQDVKQGDPVIALHVQGVERTGASADSYRRRTCVVPAVSVFAGGAPTRPSRARGTPGRKVARASAGRTPRTPPSGDSQDRTACPALAAFTHDLMCASARRPPSTPPGPASPRSEPGSAPCRPYRPRGTVPTLHLPGNRPGRDAWLQLFATLRAHPAADAPSGPPRSQRPHLACVHVGRFAHGMSRLRLVGGAVPGSSTTG